MPRSIAGAESLGGLIKFPRVKQAEIPHRQEHPSFFHHPDDKVSDHARSNSIIKIPSLLQRQLSWQKVTEFMWCR